MSSVLRIHGKTSDALRRVKANESMNLLGEFDAHIGDDTGV